MNNNNGFSLVELIVVVAILAIFGAAIVGFLFTGTNSYKNVSKDSELQYNAQLCINQLENLIIDASKGLEYSYKAEGSSDETKITSESEISGTVEEKTLIIYNNEDIYYVKWKDDSLTLRQDLIDSATGSVTTVGDDVLMADGVSSFACTINSKKRIVKLDITFFKADISFNTIRNITLRNGIIINGDINDMYEEADSSTVEEVRIFYKGKDVTGKSVSELLKITGDTKGDMKFSAKVIGKNYPSQEVAWKISEEISENTTISDGRLIIAADETVYNMTIQAISKQNTSKSASTEAVLREITGISLSKEPEKEDYFEEDVFEATANISGINLIEEDKLVNWSVSNAQNTGSYENNDNKQSFKITGEADNYVVVRATPKSDSSFSDEFKLLICEKDYKITIRWKDKSSSEAKRGTATEKIIAEVTPDPKGKYTVQWEMSLLDTSGKDVTGSSGKSFYLSSASGNETQIIGERSFDWNFRGRVAVRAYIVVNGTRIYSDYLSVPVLVVTIRYWNSYNQSTDFTADGNTATADFWVRESKTFHYEIVSGYDGNFGVRDNDKNGLYATSMDDNTVYLGRVVKSVTITAYDRPGTGPLYIQLDNRTCITLYIKIH